MPEAWPLCRTMLSGGGGSRGWGVGEPLPPPASYQALNRRGPPSHGSLSPPPPPWSTTAAPAEANMPSNSMQLRPGQTGICGPAGASGQHHQHHTHRHSQGARLSQDVPSQGEAGDRVQRCHCPTPSCTPFSPATAWRVTTIWTTRSPTDHSPPNAGPDTARHVHLRLTIGCTEHHRSHRDHNDRSTTGGPVFVGRTRAAGHGERWPPHNVAGGNRDCHP